MACSQFEVGGWHLKIGEPTLADTFCDRIVLDSYYIVIGGADSMRKRKGISKKPNGFIGALPRTPEFIAFVLPRRVMLMLQTKIRATPAGITLLAKPHVALGSSA